ncbi:MAG: hypothetical protein P8N31_07435 [Planctomycetota bacterium]|nr:hypothetical protein [Planctomycetota bacterium]MDG2143370.1 hypothetical protein [Planctomycetota bacterium]
MTGNSDKLFEQQIHDAFESLRAALVDLFASVHVDKLKPYPLARLLDINKNLTWKVSKIIRAERPSEALRHIPGPGGIKLLLDAFASHGAAAETVERARSAFDALDKLIEHHTGDRETLEVMLDGLAARESDGASLVATRKLAFRGNSGIWGMQTRARMTTFVMAPSKDKDPDSAIFDSMLITGLVGLQRLRPETPWTLLSLASYSDDGTLREPLGNPGPLNPSAFAELGIPLLHKFCTGGTQEDLAIHTEGGETVVELPVGPVGKRGKRDIFFGRIDREFASLHSSPADQTGEFLTDFMLPIEHCQFDVLVHKDLEGVDDCTFKLFGRLYGRIAAPNDRRDDSALPIPIEVRDLGLGLDAMATDIYPRYCELIQDTFLGVGFDPAEFRTLRVTLEYPPMGTTGVFSFPLRK